MTKPSRNSTRARRICFEKHKKQDESGRVYMDCHLCPARINPVLDRWEADHIERHAEDGEETAENLWPAHYACHKTKTNTIDKPEIAKGKRYGAKHVGVKKRKGPPMPGSRDSKWKRPMRGPPVLR